MKNSILCLLPALTLCLSTACHRNDMRTEIFRIEQMRNPESVQLISKALQPLGGVKEITPNYDDRELIVEFNGLSLYKKNIEYAIVYAGFSLPHWPAPEAAKAELPEELR